jgi:hypothetical protein
VSGKSLLLGLKKNPKTRAAARPKQVSAQESPSRCAIRPYVGIPKNPGVCRIAARNREVAP